MTAADGKAGHLQPVGARPSAGGDLLTDKNGDADLEEYRKAFERGDFAEMLAHFCHEGGSPVNQRETDGHLCSWGSFDGENPDERYEPTPEEYGRAIIRRIECGWAGC